MPAIVQNGDPILRKKAKPVPISAITTKEIKEVIARMKKALASQNDGVAIAAPQIGEPLRIFVVAGKIFDEAFERGKENIMPPGKKMPADLIFINPEIIKLSKKMKWMQEGCLSVRPLYGEVKRSLNATVRAYDEKGVKFERGAGGLLAHIFQHEVDHLNGILFIDKARDIHEEERAESSY
jgi:peptide deformylase